MNDHQRMPGKPIFLEKFFGLPEGVCGDRKIQCGFPHSHSDLSDQV